MRINCLGVARLQDHNGKYCVLLNRGHLQRNGERTLSPIGGTLHFEPTGKSALERLGAKDFRGANLLFTVPEPSVPQVSQWFRKRFGRETSVLRELGKKLIETKALRPAEVAHANESDVVTFGRFDGSVPPTISFVETYPVAMDTAALHRLRLASGQPITQRLVYFVTAEEIKASTTVDGVKISKITRSVL